MEEGKDDLALKQRNLPEAKRRGTRAFEVEKGNLKKK